MTPLLSALLAWIPFINPLQLPAGARLWMFLPLAACVAVVYRATRARTARELPRATLKTFLTIVIGMWLIAIAAYAVHAAVLRLSGD
jgi:formate-dependent nitrite reductase membrane component NrfD